jgi:hypothetical protein
MPLSGQLTEKAAPSRPNDLTRDERKDLFDEMTSWYYHNGFGMCVTSSCRNIFLKAGEAQLNGRQGPCLPFLRAMRTQPLAQRRWTSPDVPFTCSDSGWTWPSVASYLALLAPNLAPRNLVSVS